MRRYIGIVLVGALAVTGATFIGCSDDDDNGGTGGSGGGGGGGAVVDLCTDNGGSGEVQISNEDITENTLLTADCTYRLTRQIYVGGGATLTVNPGVQVVGDNGSALIVTTNGRIEAEGTADEPIVFTSSRAVGQRAPGDWGGVVMLGTAPLSWGSPAGCNGELGECRSNIEGLPDTEARGIFGGNDPSHDCGSLEYVRIEFAGFVFGEDNELNSLTLGGCGTDTNLDFIQVHRGEDDGFEFFGGLADLSHGICTGTGDDCVDWDQGYRGNITNFIAHHFAGNSSDPRGIEADNWSENNDVEPRSAPMVRYGTVVASPGGVTDQGIVLRRGTLGVLDGLVVAYYDGPGFDMRDASWRDGNWTTNDPDSALVVKNSCFTDNDPDWPAVGTNCGQPGATGDCNDPEGVPGDQTFDELTELAQPALNNQIVAPNDLGLLVSDIAPAATGGAPDYSVNDASGCAGAFAPSGDDWTTGWTSYPEN